MLYNLNNDILFKIIKYEPIKSIKISSKIYKLMKSNKKLEKYIIKKYYNVFNLYNIDKTAVDWYCILFPLIKTIESFFEISIECFLIIF